MRPEYFLIAAIVLTAIAIPVALYAWMTSPAAVAIGRSLKRRDQGGTA